MTRVGITGGIGSGKSTVCKLFARCGILVYDSDSRARELMNSHVAGGDKIRHEIEALFGSKAYRGEQLDRAYIASKAFDDKSLLTSLNAIVHPLVAQDFENWAETVAGTFPDVPYVVLESAILFESGFDKLVDKTITVSAPVGICVERVVARSGGAQTVAEVRARMANQMNDRERELRADYIIHNFGTRSELAAHVRELDKLLTQ